MTIAVYVLAAFAEIARCFAFWARARADRSHLWLVAGTLSLCPFAFLLTRAVTALAGRAFAAYGGGYIAASLAWLWAAGGARPGRWDVLGGAVCLAGAAIIAWAPRGG